MHIGIVTDSTADLPQELIAEYGIEVVPLQVTIGEEHFQDGIDLTSTQFYEKISHTSTMPLTSQPALGVFTECYRTLLQKFDVIISIHMTEKLSGTFRTAQIASEMFPQGVVKVIDSFSTTMGLGGVVLEAARALRRGMNVDQVLKLIKDLRETINFVVILNTLEFIARGGRVRKSQAMLGSILGIKPVLRVVRGDVEIIEKVRSRREMIAILFEKFKEQMTDETRMIIAVMHTAAEADALKLKMLVQTTFQNAEVIFNQAGPVLGVHVGPGALALIGIPKQ